MRLRFYICPHLQGVVEEVGGFLVFVLVSVDQSQNVEHRRDVRMIVTRSLLQVLQGLGGSELARGRRIYMSGKRRDGREE